MTEEEKVQAFTQAVYRIRYNRFLDDIASTEGEEEVNKTIGWINEAIDEIEGEADWHWIRENDYNLGSIATASDTFSLPTGYLRLVVDENRPLYVKQGDSIVSVWDIVNPNQITDRNTYSTREQRVTFVNDTVVFSREFNDTEIGGDVFADVVQEIPEAATDDASPIDLVKPKILLKYAVAKNATLPDIVQGGLSPSFAQKYNDELEKAKERNMAGSVMNTVVTDDLSGIGGVY